MAVALIFKDDWELTRWKMAQRRKGKRAFQDSGRARVKSQKQETA